MKKPGIRDVARHASVSIATVSHVLNNTRFVAPETRECVLRSIRILGYNPNVSARSLKTGKKYLIAFIVPDISNPFFSALIEVVEATLAQEKYKLLIINTKETLAREIEHFRLLAGMVDGFLVASTACEYEEVAAAIPAATPVVFIDRKLAGAPYDAVFVNNYEALVEGTQYLLRRGHTRIGYISGLPHISTSRERMEAYRDAMQQAGLPYEPYLLQGDSTGQNVPRLVDELLEKACSALIVSNNRMATAACMQLLEKGMRPGLDIEMVGFKDMEYEQYALRYMHTIAQPTVSLGRIAAEKLLERLVQPELPLREVSLLSAFQPSAQMVLRPQEGR